MPIPGWEKNITRETSFYVLPLMNTTIIDPMHICAEKLFLLIVVCSSSVNFEIRYVCGQTAAGLLINCNNASLHRQSIRETWANLTEFNYPFFANVHAKFKGQYLDINYKDWKQYVVSLPTEKLHSPLSITDNAADTDENDPRYKRFAVKVVFLVGQTPNNETQARINAESEFNGDLIQESFLDSYNNLTLKTIMMLKWVNGNCCDRGKVYAETFLRVIFFN